MAGGTSSASATESASPLYEAAAEFGYPGWAFGVSSYAFLGDGSIVCGYDSDGFTHFAVLDPETGALESLDVDLDSWGSPYVCADGNDVVVVAGAATVPAQVSRIDVTSGALRDAPRRASSRRSPRRTSRHRESSSSRPRAA